MSKSAVGPSASQISEKWNRRMKTSITDITAGIDRVTESPMEAAAAKQDKMIQNLTESVQSGKWAASLRKVSLADWKGKTKEKVIQRLSGGVDAAMAKRQEFDQYLVTTLNAILPTIAAMPDMNIEDSKARVGAMMDYMHTHKYK